MRSGAARALQPGPVCSYRALLWAREAGVFFALLALCLFLSASRPKGS